jgi:hypothetical protein
MSIFHKPAPIVRVSDEVKYGPPPNMLAAATGFQASMPMITRPGGGAEHPVKLTPATARMDFEIISHPDLGGGPGHPIPIERAQS